jgi:hypothetical protein
MQYNGFMFEQMIIGWALVMGLLLILTVLDFVMYVFFPQKPKRRVVTYIRRK